MPRSIIIFILVSISLNIFSQDKRLYQLVSKKKNESFISVEAGSYIGASLISKRMELNLGYNFLTFPGYFISTELYLLRLNLSEDLKFGTGVGGGIVIRPDISGFSSDAYLRIPFRLSYKNFFIKAVPMIGSSMFKKKIDWRVNCFIGIGYQFDLYREESDKVDNSAEESEASKELTKEESDALQKKYEKIQEEEMQKQKESAEEGSTE